MKPLLMLAVALASWLTSSHAGPKTAAGAPIGGAAERLLASPPARIMGADSVLDVSGESDFRFRVGAVARHDPKTGLWRYEYDVTLISEGELDVFAIDTRTEATLETPTGWWAVKSWESRSRVAAWTRSPTAPGPPPRRMRFVMESRFGPSLAQFYGEPVREDLDEEEGEEEGDELAPLTLFNTGSTGLTIGPSANARGGVPVPRRLHAVATPPSGSATVVYETREEGEIHLSVTGPKRKLIASLLTGRVEPGVSGLVWNGLDDDFRPVRSGAYRFRLEFDGREVSSVPIHVP